MNFNELNLIEPIKRALRECNYKEPTEIQSKAIPLVLQRNDLLACAQTGTGKTAAFVLPIVQLIDNKEAKHNKPVRLRSLIVTPTRELAIQISNNIKTYSKYTNVKQAVIFGGVKQHKQVQTLKKGAHILVATPGRLLDLISQGIITLEHIKLFVLDEADRMLDMGFINDIKKLLKLLPKNKQSLFFSATLPPNIIKLSQQILINPKRIEVTPVSSAAETVQQYVYYTNKKTKKSLLLHILKNPEISQVLIFARTKHGADRICRDLKKKNFRALAIHGNKAQNQRQKALNKFKDNEIQILVATDIAARGIDINSLKYVLNYDIPNEAETYVHRIGRSGRAGKNGVAISLCEPEENAYISNIEKLIGPVISKVEEHPYLQTDRPMTAQEKKEWNKEKNKRKQAFFKNRKKR